VARKKRKRGPGRAPVFGFGNDLLDATPDATLDLHGDSAHHAERRVKDFVRSQALLRGERVVHIITGRGLGSKRGPVLLGVVKRLLDSELSAQVAEYDRDLDEGGFLIRLR
jgi:DNA-nicking Smr family endonuclease